MSITREAAYLYLCSKELAKMNKKLRHLSKEAQHHGQKHAAATDEKSRYKHSKNHEHAVRKDMWTFSGEPGLSEGVADGGKLYASPTTKTSFIKFPRTPQVINFSNSQSDAIAVEEVEGFLNQPQLEVPSKDGYKNSFEMTVIYRITNPYLVTSKVGAGKAYQLEVGNRAKRVIFDTVGNLKAEELYDVDKRVPVLAEAQKALNDELTPNGITVDHLLLRKFSYSEDYEKILDDKVLQDQLRIAAEREKEAA